MSPDAIVIRRLDAAEARARAGALAAILLDSVEGGASVGFMAPLTAARATAFWDGVAEGVASGGRLLFVAEDQASSRLVGTVQLVLATQENQPHRAEIAKMLVDRAARRHGIGGRLMAAAEAASREAGRTLLVLDTASDDAERLYERRGWVRVGIVPDYALLPDGRPCATVFYYKQLA